MESKKVWCMLLEKLLCMERNSVRTSVRKGRRKCTEGGKMYQ